jgi:hypothetical protein
MGPPFFVQRMERRRIDLERLFARTTPFDAASPILNGAVWKNFWSAHRPSVTIS